VHGITRAKVGGGQDPAQAAEEREAYAEWAAKLSYAAVHRLWQLLLKGLAEVHAAPSPLEAAEMALLRVIHASDLPDPGELAAKLASGETVAAPVAPAASQGEGQGALLAMPESFPAMIKALEANGNAHLAQQLHDYIGLVSYAPPELVIRPAKPLSGDFVRDLAGALKAATGATWQVRAVDAPAAPSLLEQDKAAADRLRQDVLDSPAVKAAFESFPDAELVGFALDDKRSA